MKPIVAQRLATALRWLLGLLFLWAAVSKLANPPDFLGSIYAYQLPLPRSWLQITAVVLPWVELLSGLMLLLNVWAETSLLMACVLIFLFLVSTGQAWARGIDISCGCFNLKIFGLDQSHPGIVKFVESVAFAFFRNLFLAGIAAFVVRQRLTELKSAVIPQAPAVPVRQQPAKPQKRANIAR
jgi:putative oxidoreductase